MEALVEFGTGAWLLILAYDLALLAAFALPCDDDLPFPWLRVFFLAPGVVVGLRLWLVEEVALGPLGEEMGDRLWVVRKNVDTVTRTIRRNNKITRADIVT